MHDKGENFYRGNIVKNNKNWHYLLRVGFENNTEKWGHHSRMAQFSFIAKIACFYLKF